MTYPTKSEVFSSVYTEHLLKQEHYRISCELPLDAFELTFDVSEFTRDLIMRMQYKIYSEDMGHVEERVHFEVYCTWWDHLKADYAPKWFRKMFPVCTRLETKSVNISSKALYPKFRPMKDQDVVVVREITRPGIYNGTR